MAAVISIRKYCCGRCASESPRVPVPAAATSSVAFGPSSNNEVKSTTNDSGIVPQSVADFGIGRDDARIAARIRPPNSDVR